jgi:hypothetical protein
MIMRMLSCFALVALVSCSALALEVPFAVEEPLGAERKLEVVSGGIPFPEGKYKDPTAFSLFDGATEVPVQVSPMVKYPDGSLHWALVSFPVTLKANEKKTFTLKDAPGKVQPPNPVTVKEAGDLVEVSNGLVTFAVNKANFNGFEWVKVGGKEVFKAAKAGLVANGKGGADKPISFDFYYRGPVRTTIYVKGRYGDQKSPTFAMAITLNAGENALHIAHNLRNACLGATKTKIAAPQICLGLAGDLKAEGGGTAPQAGKSPPAFGWQNFSGAADLLVFLRHGGPGNGGVYKAEVADGQLAVYLSTNEAKEYDIADGAHKTTDVHMVFGKSASTEALSEPLHALASCAYLSENDGFGVGRGWGSLADETQTYKNADWKNADDPKKMPREAVNPNLYVGWFDSHRTSECDHLQGMVFGYVRTGQRGYLDQAHSWSHYWRTFLLWRSDEWLYGKDGRYNTPKWGDGRCCTEGCHFYGVGIFNYALLTGEIDALEAAYDWAEMANVAWYGRYTGKKPGDSISDWGSRGFSRSYLAVARADDVARAKYWEACLLPYVKVAPQARGRDPRGFTTGWSGSNPGAAAGRFKDKEALNKVLQEEGITIEGNMVKHPKYGAYRPMSASSWPEAMESMANYMAYEALKDSPDPACQVAAEDALDYCIAAAYLGLHYIYNTKDNCVYYYMAMDYPRPDDCGGGSNDSWYTKWWPNTMAYGYTLTGDKALKARMLDTIWWGLARDYVHPPKIPQGDAPTYSRVERNTKGDWMTPSAFAFGVGSRPRKDEAAPAAITDLKASAVGGGKVELSWTAPKDEGGGKVAKYQVKWSDRPICDYLTPGDEYRSHFKDGKLDVTYWNMAKNVAGEPVPGEPGKAEKATLTVEPGARYFTIRSYDDTHNFSKLGNVVQVEVK